MNKLCVIARNHSTYFMKRLTEEVDLDVFNPWESAHLPLAENYLVRTTGVYGDDRDLEVLRKTERNVINPVLSHELLRDKSRQFTLLENAELPVIPWRRLDSCEDFLPDKILVKPIRGQGGWGIKVMGKEEFLSWKTSTTDRSWIIQPYLEGQSEFRLFFCGGEEILLERTGDLAANFTQGGEARRIPLKDDFKGLVPKIRKLTGIQYGAIDLFLTKGELRILEINPVPGIEQLEKVTGENIIRKVLSLFQV